MVEAPCGGYAARRGGPALYRRRARRDRATRALPEGLAEPAILSAAEAFVLDALPDGPGTLAVRFDVQPGYYLYRDKIAVRALGDGVAGGGDSSITLSELPNGERRDDPVFGPVDVFPRPVAFTVETTSPDDVEIELSYQGCAEAGVCYQPQRVRLFIGGTGP